MGRSSRCDRIIAVWLPLLLALGACRAPGVDPDPTNGVRVGHRVERMVVPGSTQGESRMVDVQLWYPASAEGFSDLPKSRYASALHGRTLIPGQFDPLSWSLEAKLARESAAIDPATDRSFPVIVFSHGSVNDPIDYAYTLEALAGAGFVVAAPSHVNNTQDDVRIDFVNTKLGSGFFGCNDGRPPPCSRTVLPRSMDDRVRDVGKALDLLPSWFGDRVDLQRVGMMGHSRGTAASLAAAGGSTTWGFGPEPRIKAIFGMAIAVQTIVSEINLAAVNIPTLLVAGTLDATSPQTVSDFAYQNISSSVKTFVSIQGGVHRVFDSSYCAQVQAAGAIAQASTKAILDLHTVNGIMNHATSGKAPEYCSYATFTEPADIRPLVSSLGASGLSSTSVPSSGRETEEVKGGMAELAGSFFDAVLNHQGDPVQSKPCIAAAWTEKYGPMLASVASTVDCGM